MVTIVSNATDYEGGCHCRLVRYVCTREPRNTFFCHCGDCQRTTGSPFSVELMISSDSFEIHGELNSYAVTGDSGQLVHRRFCPNCGSGLYLVGEADPGWIFLKAGTLDDATWLQPDMHIYTTAKQPWVELADALPKYDAAP